MAGGRTLSTRRIHAGKVLSLDLDEVEEPGGVKAVREVVRHSGSVATLALDGEGRLALVRQWRHPVGQSIWELPAGRLDPGETPEQGALRELGEEIGRTAAKVEKISTYYTTPGFCDEVMHLFRATGLAEVEAHPDEDERIETRWVALDEALAMVERGEIKEGKTLVALLLEARRRA